MVMLEEGKPLIFGSNKDKGIKLNGLNPEVVTLGDGIGQDDLLVHQPKNPNSAYANILAQMNYPTFPTPVGILRQLDGRETYEDALNQQIEHAKSGEKEIYKSCSRVKIHGLLMNDFFQSC